ncbi:MAG: toll/interleukin-1 receptor domain-containing protein [Sphingomonadales bacterium]|nr:toll/interleukin-1 receptor domain-containing protein [Sphingomonadales bacterium]
MFIETAQPKSPELNARFRAFISYSHRDKILAAWLHRRLETFDIPRKLVGVATPIGPVPRRLTPIFRDRDDLPAASDLGSTIEEALANSQFLLVICSPASAKSPWVDREIATFKQMHGEDRILALIVAGNPYASNNPDQAHEECFPPSLRFKLIDGQISNIPAEPIAADLRREADGRRLATLKLVAGLSGLPLDKIVQRHAQRRMRRLALLSAGSMMGMVVTGGLAIYANALRIEANEQRQIAERESATARATSDFLIGTFALSDPQNDKPETITARTILDRGAARARTELAREPVVQARLVSTLGQAYNNLSLYEDARKTIEQSLPSIGRAGSGGASAWQTLASTYLHEGQLAEARRALAKSDLLLGQDKAPNADLKARSAVIEGMIDIAEGRTREGITAFRRSLLLYESDSSISPEKIATALQNLGLLLSDDGQFAAAKEALQKALAISRRTLGDRHLRTGQLWYALAQNSFLAGDLPAAQQAIGRALAIESRVLAPNSRILADTYSMQGQIFHGQKRPRAAQEALDHAVDIYKQAFRGPHYLIGIALVYRALAEADLGNTAAALKTLAEAKHNYDESYGRLHPNHGDLLVNRAVILAKAGRRPEALKDCADGVRIVDNTLGRDANFTKSLIKICRGL